MPEDRDKRAGQGRSWEGKGMERLFLGETSDREGAGAALEAKRVLGWDPRPSP